jgi:putative hydrolase of the HAD superfamily
MLTHFLILAMSTVSVTSYAAVLFDLFHTLVSIRHIKAPGRNTCAILGITEKVWTDAVFNKSGERLRGHITEPVKIIRSIADQIDPAIDRDKIEAAAETRYARFAYALNHIPRNTLETVRKIKELGLKIGLVSNADCLERKGWEQSEIARFFDAAVFSCDVGLIKPEKEIYLMCARQLEVLPAQCLFVGDGNCNELNGAKEAGMDTVFTSEFYDATAAELIEERKKIADFHITNINQLVQGEIGLTGE